MRPPQLILELQVAANQHIMVFVVKVREIQIAASKGPETGHLLQLFRIASPLHRDLGGGGIDVTEIVRREFD